MNENQPRHEPAQAPENDIRASLTAARAHILLATVDTSFLNPDKKAASPKQTELIKTATAEQLPWKAADSVSNDSRATYYNGDTREKDVQIKDWNEAIATWVEDSTSDSNNDSEKEDRIAALASLGIDKTGNLVQKVDQFRSKYLSEDTSDIKQFAQDFSEGCKKADGSVDMQVLHARLDAIKPLLDTFGHENDVADIVTDLIVARGTLTQKADSKAQIAQSSKFQVTRPMTPAEDNRLKALWDKQQSISNQTPPPERPKPAAQLQPESVGNQILPTPEVKFKQKYTGPGGETYDVISLGKDLPLAIRGADNNIVIGNEAAKIISQSSLVEEVQEEQPPEDPNAPKMDGAEAIKQFGEGIIGALKGVGEVMEKQNVKIDAAQKLIQRSLSTAELNFITHGGSAEELEQIINAKLETDSNKAYEQVQIDGESTLYLRGLYDLQKTLTNLGENGKVAFIQERLQELAPLDAAFMKAQELKTKPQFVLTLQKQPDGTIIPIPNIALTAFTNKPDGTAYSEDEKQAIIKEIGEAGNKAQAETPQIEPVQETAGHSEPQ